MSNALELRDTDGNELIVYIELSNGRLAAFTACNAGCTDIFSIEYDNDKSYNRNLYELVELLEENGYTLI